MIRRAGIGLAVLAFAALVWLLTTERGDFDADPEHRDVLASPL